MTDTPPAPTFLFGITPRSGTNYFYNLLRAHPELHCVTSEAMPEDFLVYHSEQLIRYADLVSTWWTQHKRPGSDARSTAAVRAVSRARITEALGRSLAEVLRQPDTGDRQVVTKTPTVRNLGNVFALLPRAKVLLLVRDGRDQTESAVRSYGVSHEFAMQRWAEAARVILDFTRAEEGVEPARHRVVRYEDLLTEPEATLGGVFAFLGVDPGVYDYATGDSLPVYGSSQHIPQGHDLRQTYQRLERTADFTPQGRWASWDDARLERFNYVAGDEMERLGYPLTGPRPDGLVRHRVRDVPFRARTGVLTSLAAAERLVTATRVYQRSARRFPLSQ